MALVKKILENGIKYMSKTLQDHLDEVELIADGVGYGIETLIKRPVAILRYKGFPTCMSCEGHADRENSFPWIWIDAFPQYPHDIFRSEWDKIVNDKIKFQELKDSNDYYKQKLQYLINQSGLIDYFRIEDVGTHFYNSFKFWSLGPSLEEAQKTMIDFTEWLIKND